MFSGVRRSELQRIRRRNGRQAKGCADSCIGQLAAMGVKPRQQMLEATGRVAGADGHVDGMALGFGFQGHGLTSGVRARRAQEVG